MVPTPPAAKLSPTESTQLLDAIEGTVLKGASVSRGLDNDTEAYLRLVDATDVAARGCERLRATAVDQARRVGHSWGAIGETLGISRQAAQQRFGRDQSTPRRGRRTLQGAHAFNEMQMLETEGLAGNHLVDFGPLFLVVESSEQPWEHRRVVSLRSLSSLRPRLEADGWIYVGSWFPFHYFKRPRG